MKEIITDVAIIGAGPSGMAAALAAKRERPSLRVHIIEKNAKPGKKLRATGNGRCNILNTGAPGYEEARAFLGSIGVAVRAYPGGLLYPYSESAADVTELLAAALEEAEVDIVNSTTVIRFEKEAGHFVIECRWDADTQGAHPSDPSASNITITATHLILACGGKAGPSYGTIGDGYKWARNIGHTVISPIPILTGIECSGALATLAGTRALGTAKLYRDVDEHFGPETLAFEEDGEIQFTKYGLSGICIFNMTRFMRFEKGTSMSQFMIELDMNPDGGLEEFLRERRAAAVNASTSTTAAKSLRTFFKPALSEEIIRQAATEAKPIADMTDDELEAIAYAAHHLRFTPTGIRGWKEAQCTQGGVSLDEIDEATSESKLCENLYITGELADYDGPCGGYNLTYAWLSGIRAGKAIAGKHN